MPYDVGGSGDCFFRSVSHQLYGTPELHFEIRMAGIKHLNNHPEIYIESFSDSSWEDYIRLMSIPGTWCDNIIIQAVANAHNCIVHITESDVDKPHGTIITPIVFMREDQIQYLLDILMSYTMFQPFHFKIVKIETNLHI